MKTFFLFMSLFVNLVGSAQFPQCLMPGNGFGKIDDDTLLNTKRVLLNSDIKKIYARQTYRESVKISRTTVINGTGNIMSISNCVSKDDKIESLCSFDTIFYNGPGRISEIRSRDAYGYEISRKIFEYIGEHESIVTSITNMPDEQWDTLIDHKYFNKKGQMVKLTQIIKGRTHETSLYYYNSDGFLDSVQYEKSPLSTIIYRRTEKGKKKIIEAQIQHSIFKWIFNATGQCISTTITAASLPGSNNANIIKSRIEYRYNANSTLSKATLKRNNEVKATMYYSYSK